MTDEVREFHLDGKQLAFLVISAIGLAVVVFLCGVMVGRGVRQTQVNEVADAAPSILVDPSRDPASPNFDRPITADGTVRTSGDLTDPARVAPERPPDIVREPSAAGPKGPALQNLSPAVTSKPEAPIAQPVTPPSVTPPIASREAAAPPAAAKATPGLPRKGYAVQVKAVTSAAEAERLVKTLKSKGYPSYSMPRGKLFGVRVGSYPTKDAAETVMARLKKDEGYKELWLITP